MSKERKREMKRGLLSALAVCVALLVGAIGAVPASAEFGMESFDASFENEDGTTATQAGSHPFAMTTSFDISSIETEFGGRLLEESVKDLLVAQPDGFIGDPTATPRCSNVDFLTQSPSVFPEANSCPASTALGYIEVKLANAFVSGISYWSPVYNLAPPPGRPSAFGFWTLGATPVQVLVGVEQDPPYNVLAETLHPSQTVEFVGAVLTLWGNPADPAHDPVRGNCVFPITPQGAPMPISRGECPVDIDVEPFLTLPRACRGPLATKWEMDSIPNPGKWISGSVLTHDEFGNPQGFTGCGRLGYEPEIEAKPTTKSAETGTGLDVTVNFEDEGLANPEGLAQSETKKVIVTFPEGVTVNPSVGEGLGVCTPEDIERETLKSNPGDGCPNSSKLGTLFLRTPLVDEAIEGSVFLAEQDDPTTDTPGAENPFDSLIALYAVLRNENLGVIVKQPVKVEPDPETGQLVATADDIPQFPFSHFNFHFREGQRAPLVSPPACGTYTAKAEFFPWSDTDNPHTILTDFEVTEGVGSGPCPPGGIPPFAPHFEAGSLNNNAGSFSPFNMRLIRNDGEQDMTKFSSVLPPGVLGSLAGVSKCPDALVELAKTKTGREEQAAPSCPAGSLIGTTKAGAGVGGALTYVPGQIYLGGPYKGAPLSVVSITPAVAGPFDAGTVVVRLGLTLNPRTAEVEVDGAASDPIPHILKGIVLKVRDLRVYVDRPNFTLNPTSCDESSAKATLFGSFLDVLDPADDVPVALATRYQAANCLNLGHNPRLGLRLTGGTRRGAHPGLRAVYRPRPGDANVEGVVVRLPRSAFLDQGHIRTICTRVQFAAEACPKGARYGFVRAWTPLLDEPLQGAAYLRSSNNKLPDLVFDLKGIVDIEVSSRIDSVRGGIRATFDDLPDAPISAVVVRMQGGKKGLIVNSRDLCARKSRANVRIDAQNGKRRNLRPPVRPSCKKAKRSSRGRAPRAALGGSGAVR